MFVPAYQQAGAAGAQPLFMQPGAASPAQPQAPQPQEPQTQPQPQPSASQAFILNPAAQAQHRSGIPQAPAASAMPVGAALASLEPAPAAPLQQQQQPTAATTTFVPAGITPPAATATAAAPVETVERVPIVPCPPEVVRCTLGAVPPAGMLGKTGIPLTAVVRPLAVAAGTEADAAVPLVPFEKTGIVRCRGCRTYINPYVAFVDGGRRWKCNLCGFVNDVRAEYYSPVVAATGQRRDVASRPELTHACVEFCASTEYMSRAPMPPVYVFVVDVSATAVAQGLVAAVAEGLRAWVRGFAGHRRTRVGFVLYDSRVTYVNLRASPARRPVLQVCGDLDECERIGALPPSRYEELVVNLADNAAAVERLLADLPAMCAGTRDAGVAYQSAVAAACQCLKPWGGRIVSFVSGLPNVGNSALAPRGADDFARRGGLTAAQAQEREAGFARALATDAGEYAKSIALECSRRQCTVDVVLTGARHQELATLAQMAQFTGGEVLHLPGFAPADAPDLARALGALLARPVAWEAVVRFRYSEGLRAQDYHGNFFLRSTDLLVVPCADGGKAVTVHMAVAGTPAPQCRGPAGDAAFLQVAYLYTSSLGERRIRVATLPLPLTDSLAAVYSSVDGDCLVAALAKMCADKLLAAKVTDAREALLTKAVSILSAYRSFAIGGNGSGVSGAANALATAPSMATLPLYLLALLKSPMLVVAAPDVRPDVRAAAIAATRTMPVEHLLVALHPQLLDLSSIVEEAEKNASAEGGEDAEVATPPLLPLTEASLSPAAAYLLNCGDRVLVYVGRAAGPQFLTLLFGVESRADIAHRAFPRLETAASRAVWRLVDAIVAARVAAQLDPPPVHVTLDDRDLARYLIADRTRNFYNYQEFVDQLQRNVLKKN